MRETELKFAIPESFSLPPFDDLKRKVKVKERSSQDLRATYYDTDDLRLARNGITLRYRTGEEEGDGWSLKLPSQIDAYTREELHFEGIPMHVPSEAVRLVTAFVRSAALDPVATLRTKRQRWALLNPDEEEIAELVEDDVSVVEDGRSVARFSELELEQRKGNRRDLDDIARLLHAAGAAQAEPIPKAVRALGARATAPPDIVPVEPGDPGEPAAVAVRAAITKNVLRLVHNDPLARMGDPEGVHQVRVGARRLRSDLRSFKPLVDSEWARETSDELQWIGSALGEARDMDVLQDRLRQSADGLESDLGPLWEQLAERRTRGRQKALDALESQRYRSLLDRLVEAAAEPRLEWRAITTPSSSALPPLVKKAWKRLAGGARALEVEDTDEQWHRVRIRAKRVRYVSEAVAPSLEPEAAKDARAFAKMAESIQELLGNHQDAVVAKEFIREIATKRSDERFSFAMGRLFERQQADSEGLRTKFFDTWQEFDRKRHRDWLKT